MTEQEENDVSLTDVVVFIFDGYDFIYFEPDD